MSDLTLDYTVYTVCIMCVYCFGKADLSKRGPSSCDTGRQMKSRPANRSLNCETLASDRTTVSGTEWRLKLLCRKALWSRCRTPVRKTGAGKVKGSANFRSNAQYLPFAQAADAVTMGKVNRVNFEGVVLHGCMHREHLLVKLHFAVTTAPTA